MLIRPRRSVPTLIAVASVLCIATVVLACGPFFPMAMLDDTDKPLRAPMAEAQEELARLKPAGAVLIKPPAKPDRDEDEEDLPDPVDETTRADLADLEAALTAQGVAKEKLAATLSDYNRFRTTLSKRAAQLAKLRETDEGKAPPPMADLPQVPAGLPKEFELYARGAAGWWMDKPDDARKAWTALLDLPAEQRPRRSTWAAFMLGKSYMKSDPAKACQYFALTRTLADKGFADSLRLAPSSLGWEAKVLLETKDYPAAAELYLQYQAAGEVAWISLRTLALAVLESDEKTMVAAAKDPACRQVVTTFVVSTGGASYMGWPYESDGAKMTRSWLAAVEKAGVTRLERAEYLAWAAYSVGDFKGARRWLDRADAAAPMALWIESKLQLRAGKLDQAAATLAKTVQALAKSQATTCFVPLDEGDMSGNAFAGVDLAGGELASLNLARGEFVTALDLLMRHGWLEDAGYVAERVLTPDELIAYVDKNWPAPDPKLADAEIEYVDDLMTTPPEKTQAARANMLRHLLARRLTRIGRWKDARAYFAPKVQPLLDAYVNAIRDGHDKHKTQAQQADALWQAAKIAREDGMQLLGAELEPDYSAWGGSFEGSAVFQRLKGTGGVLAAGKEERRRVQVSALQPNERYHYRYIAAEHAWAAAKLMPDNDDKTALVLATAGKWLANRDPKAVDRFYKALVNRCGKTALGRSADELRWFPPLPEEQAASQPASAAGR